jgi:S-adenosylmethionine-diacylgycerolhomoserine-N-methlytransferase
MTAHSGGYAGELGVLWSLVRGQRREGPLAERLEAFYAPQARDYDRFRDKLLHGRAEMLALLAPRAGERLAELGAGTGRNLEFLHECVANLESVALVDLCPSLLELARERAALWPNVQVVEADAVRYRPPRPLDCVYFCYSLTMMPAWREAIDNALVMLRHGGRIGVVDFHLPEPKSLPGRFWQRWFAHDGVHLSAEHLPYLKARTTPLRCREELGSVPYIPGLRAPYYLYVGLKRPPRYQSKT